MLYMMCNYGSSFHYNGQDSAWKVPNIFMAEETIFNSCHLFLSGDENLQDGTTQSSGNLLHFRLHLSSNGVSQHTSSPFCNLLQSETHGSNKVLSTKLPLETSEYVEDKSFQNQMEVKNNVADMQFKPKSRIPLNSQPSTLRKDSKRKKYKSADVKDAIELSIAASEALAISELVKTGSDFDILPDSTVLEVALRVKQTRNELYQDALDIISGCMTDEVDETELLNDLDEETMAAAFEDVGLSLTQVVGSPDDRCGSSSIIELGCNFSGTFSRVLDTPVSEHYHGCDGEVQSVKLQGQEVVCNGVSSQRDVGNASAMNSKVSKDSPIEFLAGDLCLGTEMHLTPQSYYSNQTTSKMLATNQEVNVDIHSFYTKENTVSSLRLQESGNEENEDHVALDRFRSRWLGGWTWKDAKVYGDVNLNTVQCIPRFPITECSSLSESANTIIEDCSSIQKPEAEGKIASVSSLAYGSLCSIGNKEILNSQDLVRASTLSLADPLCSVVPCSIPSGNNNLGIAADQENGESSNGCFRGEVKLTLKINCEGSVASKSRRELTSLKSYSRLLTSQRGSFERCKGISGFLSSDNFIGCLKHSKEAGPSELPLSNATTKSHDKEYWKDKKKNVDGPEDVNCACMSISEYVSTTDKGDVNLRRLS
ncbi:hypothetical protein GIB67_019786, partial [Kingdonia uniflora]